MSTEATEPINVITEGGTIYSNGLTKREYFAAMAMQGILSDHDNQGYTWNYEHVVADAVKIADQLINQLNQTK